MGTCLASNQLNNLHGLKIYITTCWPESKFDNSRLEGV